MKQVFTKRIVPCIVVMIYSLVFNGVIYAQTLPATWMKGSDQINQIGEYGTINVAAAENTPGARYGGASITLSNGKLLLFAGQGAGPSSSGALNDIWLYDPANNEWTWTKGAAGTNQQAVFGTRGTADAANTPGGRRTFAYSTDKTGRLWIFGGLGYGVGASSTYQNDLWRYDPATNQWTWIKGNNQNGVFANYGTQNVSSATNMPGGRYGGLSWIDKQGNFWLFGGYGYVTSGGAGYLNDLWKYDITKDEWVWMKGSNVLSQPAVYGITGVGADGNTPGGRYGGGNYWSDAAGNFYLFGGYGYASVIGYLNDLWKYNPITNQWTFLNGSQQTNENALGVYGTKGIAAAANTPGGRRYPTVWKDISDNIWLAAGYGYPGSGTTEGALNDVWKYNAATNQWTWMYYDNILNRYGAYGTRETASLSNKPGGRIGSSAWRDLQGNIWWFGGQGFAATSGSVFSNMNDLWKLQFNLPPLVDSVDIFTLNNQSPSITTQAGTLPMQATVFPASVNQVVTWSIMPVTGGAIVSNSGLITAQRNGTVWVYATAVADPVRKDSMLITISGQAIDGYAVLHFYPNPAINRIWVTIPQNHPDLQFAITDIAGRILITTTTKANALTQPMSIDVHSLPSGTYVLMVRGYGIRFNEKFVVVR